MNFSFPLNCVALLYHKPARFSHYGEPFHRGVAVSSGAISSIHQVELVSILQALRHCSQGLRDVAQRHSLLTISSLCEYGGLQNSFSGYCDQFNMLQSLHLFLNNLHKPFTRCTSGGLHRSESALRECSSLDIFHTFCSSPSIRHLLPRAVPTTDHLRYTNHPPSYPPFTIGGLLT